MATLTKIPLSYLAPNRTIPQAELGVLANTNPATLRLLTYGTRPVVGVSIGHDHGQDGGDALLWRSVLSLTFGPHHNPIGVSIVDAIGIPFAQSAVESANPVSATNPKLVAAAPVLVPGGLASLEGVVVFYADTTDAITVRITLRPVGAHNHDLGEAPGEALATISFTPTAPPKYYSQTVSFSASTLAGLGDPAFDRELELCVWQLYSPASSIQGHRLVSLTLDAGSYGVTLAGTRPPAQGDPALSHVEVGEVLTGQAVVPDLLGRIKDRYSQEGAALLGRAPGLGADAQTSDSRREFVQNVIAAHQHTGILAENEGGELVSDGAIVRDQLFVQTYALRFDQGADNRLVFDNEPVQGQGIGEPGGAGIASPLELIFRASIPAGLGAFLVRFSLGPRETTDKTCRIRVDVRGEDGVSIVTGVTSGRNRASSTLVGGYWVCEVDPIDNPAWQPIRRLRPLLRSPWSLNALLPAAQRPPVLFAPARTGGFHRVSELVRVELTQPAVRSTDTPHKTGDYRILIRLDLQKDDATYDSAARLLWMHGLTERGW